MRNILISGAAALLCAAALPATAAPSNNLAQDQGNAQSAQPSQPTQQARTRDADRRICRTARMSETRIPQRICRTQAEWNMDAADRD